MKRQVLNIKFKVFKEDVDTIMRNTELYCDSLGVTYTYNIRHRFFPFKTVITAEFSGTSKAVDDIEKYISEVSNIF